MQMVYYSKKTRKKLDLYVKEIEKLQPVRTSELPFKQVNYYYLKLLVSNQEIINKKYGKSYTLYVLPGYEHIAEERYIKDTKKPLRNDRITSNIELNFKFDDIVKNWLSQIPTVSLTLGFVKNIDSEMKPLNILLFPIRFHPLYSELKKNSNNYIFYILILF